MKKLIFSVLTLFLFVFNASAQSKGTVVTCESYDDNGVTSGVYKAWDIKKDGSFVYVIYSQDKTITKNLNLYVDKKNEKGKFIAYATEDFAYNPKTDRKKFAMYDYKFTEEGDYRLTVMADNTDALATTEVTIYFEKETSSTTADELDETDTYYYENSEITFAMDFDSEANATGEATEFRLKNGESNFFAKVQQDNDLKVTQIRVSIYTGDDYKEEVSDENFDVESKEWNWIKIPIKVTKRGKYVVDMYTENDVFINSGYFEIK